jgi:hypothetical protein
VLVLETLGTRRPPTPTAARLRRRRGRELSEAAAEPPAAPLTRVTIVRPERFGSRAEADRWLDDLQRDEQRSTDELQRAVRMLNRALHAQRVAAADPHAADVTVERALVSRIGFGAGEAVADGRYVRAWELPRSGLRRRVRSMEAPEERFAAVLGGRERVLACEDLVLRARADLDAGREREAALVVRVALEALLAELPETRADLTSEREPAGRVANAALDGALADADRATLEHALEQLEDTLRKRRLISKRSHSNSQF